MKMNVATRISSPCLRALLPLLAALAFTACKGKSEAASAAPPVSAGPTTLYALGSTTHLRKAPSADAEILEKLRIGTECIPLEPYHPGWRKVRCANKEGYVWSFLLDPQKPTVEKLTADARNPLFTLAQREDAALGAATLAPENTRLSKELGDLFFERNFELLAGMKKPRKNLPKLEISCAYENSVDECLVSSAGFIQAMDRRAETKGRMFLVTVGDSEQVAVYRGQFRYDKKSRSLTAEVLERTRFEQTPVMKQALFPTRPDPDEHPDDEVDASSPRLGQFVLNESARVILSKLPPEWKLLKRSEEGAPAVWLNGCNQRPYLLRLLPDLHGRWLAVVDKPGAPFPDERWVSAASRTKRGTTLTLSRSAEDTAPQVFEIPEVKDVPASLGEALYSSQPEKYSAHREPCGGGEAGMGPAFSGEFLPEKAMVALYGSFDPATGKSRWAPSGAERERLKQFYNNIWYELIDGRRLQTEHDSKWRAAYRVGEQEKMLFLTSTYMGNVVGLIGGGIFSKTEDGWRLERANRVMTMFREVPEFSLQGVEERGFIAVLTEPGSAAREWSSGLVLISDLEGQEGPDVVGTIPETNGVYWGACPWDEQDENASECYSYTSEWKFVPDPEHSLPELVVTTRGSRLKAQDDRDDLDKDTIKEIEPFHEVRVFSFRSGEYTLTSRQDVPPGEGTE